MSTETPISTEVEDDELDVAKPSRLSALRERLSRGGSTDFDYDEPPHVNLIPDRVLEEERVRRAQLIAASLMATSMLAIAGAYGLSVYDQSRAQSEVDAAMAQNAALNAELALYADVPRVFNAVEQAETAQSAAMGAEIRWSWVLNDLSFVTPDSVGLVSITTTLTAESFNAGSAVGPIDPARSIATLEYSGEALNYASVASWMAALDADPTYLPPTQLTSAQQEDATGLISFNNLALLSRSALSERYLLPGTEPTAAGEELPPSEPAPGGDGEEPPPAEPPTDEQPVSMGSQGRWR